MLKLGKSVDVFVQPCNNSVWFRGSCDWWFSL